MKADLKGELRQYRALTITLMAGIALSVTAFVYLLSVNIEERRGDLRVQASLHALRIESGLGATTRVVDYARLLEAFAENARSRASADEIDALAAGAGARQLCVVQPGRSAALYRYDDALACPSSDAASGPRIDVAVATGRPRASLYFRPVNANLAEIRILLAVPAATGIRALVEIPLVAVFARANAVTDEAFRTSAVSCLYVGDGDSEIRIGCTTSPSGPYPIDDANPMATPGADVHTHDFELYDRRWRVATAVMPHSIASAVSAYPIAALLFFLFITAGSAVFVYKTTAAGIHLRRQQKTLNQALDDLRRHNEELEQFSYMASHDLQTPVRHVITRATMMLEDLDSGDDAEARRSAALVLESAQRMHRLVVDLLAFCRTGDTELKVVPVDMGRLVQRKIDVLRDANRDVDFRAQVGELPTIRTDETLVSQLVQNLLANAIRFRQPGVPLTVDVGAEWDGERRRWTFHVRDNGIGIADDQLERIFLPFKQLDHERRASGTGIGLSIAKRVVERLGGSIRVESGVGRGSCFYFTLPNVYTGLGEHPLVAGMDT